ncbi:MAG TPA: putative porin [Sulfurimonas sp.]|uniref:putative porin n=1 Tax=Sulfurimonas sp. TaxID=2022749 RepID=UPI002C387C47|nr:putative porin [Sulfurimonas sp.]HUH43187.1 putative porin [Sulfurimonas sp.]
MKKIVLSTIAALAIGATGLSATQFYVDDNGQVFTTKGEGRKAINLEEAAKVLDSAEAPKEKILGGFFDRFHGEGDLRLRQEVVEKEGSADLNHERYRFRYFLNFDVTDNITLETGVSSGKYNPTSGNVSFKDDENIQEYFIDELKIDVADIKYSFGNSWARVGKQKHQIYRPIKTQLVWDNDFRLEGVNYGYKDESTMIVVGANRIHREKDNREGGNINILLAQYVHTQKLDDAKVNLGAAYYHYDNVKGNTDPYGSFKGNTSETVNGVKVYKENYGIVEAFAELKLKDVMGMPFKTALTLAYNAQASDDNFGYDLSAELDMTKKWKAAVTYRDVEKDAVFGAHNDSDFSGGGTDNNGYYVKTKYAFAKNVDVAGWWNWSKLGDLELDYHRVQLDVILKF